MKAEAHQAGGSCLTHPGTANIAAPTSSGRKCTEAIGPLTESPQVRQSEGKPGGKGGGEPNGWDGLVPQAGESPITHPRTVNPG